MDPHIFNRLEPSAKQPFAWNAPSTILFFGAVVFSHLALPVLALWKPGVRAALLKQGADTVLQRLR